MYRLALKMRSSKIMGQIHLCWELLPGVITNSLMTLMNMSSRLEAMKDLNILKKWDSKSEKKKELRLKLPSKFLQLGKTMSLKGFLKFSSKAWHPYAYPSMLSVRCLKYYVLKTYSNLTKTLQLSRCRLKRTRSGCPQFLSKTWVILTSHWRLRRYRMKVFRIVHTI